MSPSTAQIAAYSFCATVDGSALVSVRKQPMYFVESATYCATSRLSLFSARPPMGMFAGKSGVDGCLQVAARAVPVSNKPKRTTSDLMVFSDSCAKYRTRPVPPLAGEAREPSGASFAERTWVAGEGARGARVIAKQG